MNSSPASHRFPATILAKASFFIALAMSLCTVGVPRVWAQGSEAIFVTPPPSKAEAMELEQPSPSLPPSKPESWRRLHLTYLPSFSAHPKITYTWTHRGGWWTASSVHFWPPPLPEVHDAALMIDEEAQEWAAAMLRTFSDAVERPCVDDPALDRGDALLRLEDRDGAHDRCWLWRESASGGRLPATLRQVLARAGAPVGVDRWTHPFWLVEHSAMLRLELKGTADLWIDGAFYGRVNGVLELRLPVGERSLLLQAVSGDAAQEMQVRLRKNETTILRVSVDDDAMITVPSWSQPRR